MRAFTRLCATRVKWWSLPCLVTFNLLQAVSSGVAHQTSSSTTSLYQRLCPSNHCRNGQCYIVGHHARCVCDDLYTGDHCEHVDLGRVNVIVIASMVIFQWPWPPRLKGYSFVYYELYPESDQMIYKHTIRISDHESSLLMGNLNAGRSTYQVCVEDDYIADRAIATNSLEYLSNCMKIQTQPDYHTMVGWVLACMVVVLIVLIVYWQKDKIELLYFHKPPIIYEASKTDDECNADETNSELNAIHDMSSSKPISSSYSNSSDILDLKEKVRKITYQSDRSS